MKIFIYLLLVPLVASNAIRNIQDEKDLIALHSLPNLNITEDFFIDEFKIHTAENKIAKVHWPYIGNITVLETERIKNHPIFFVEAGEDKITKGVSVIINDKVTHLVPTGTSVDSSNDENITTYIGATDGLYIYNPTLNKAEKYGTITDSIIDIAKPWTTQDIYILTDKNEVFHVTESGSKKKLIPEATGAKQISINGLNDLVFYDGKHLKSITNSSVFEFKGLPESGEILLEDGLKLKANAKQVPVIFNNKYYYLNPDVSDAPVYASVDFEKMPDDFSQDGSMVMLIVKNKNIYKYNLIDIVTTAIGDSLPAYKQYLITFLRTMVRFIPEDIKQKVRYDWLLDHIRD